MHIARCQPAFVVGTGRCGSTLLSELVRDFTSVLSLSEMFTVSGGRAALAAQSLDGPALWTQLSQLGDDGRALLADPSSIDEILATSESPANSTPLELVPLPHLTDQPSELYRRLREFTLGLPSAGAAEQYSKLFDWLAGRFGKTRWVERSGGSLEYVDRLLELWPDAKFVHVFRAGPDCAVSMSRHPFFRVRVARMLSHDPNLPVPQALAQEIALPRFGAYWSAVILHGVRQLVRLPPGQILHVSYAGLTSDPATELQRILTFLEAGELDAAQRAAVARRTRAPAQPPAGLSAAAREELVRSCRPGARVTAELGAGADADHT